MRYIASVSFGKDSLAEKQNENKFEKVWRER